MNWNVAKQIGEMLQHLEEDTAILDSKWESVTNLSCKANWDMLQGLATVTDLNEMLQG